MLPEITVPQAEEHKALVIQQLIKLGTQASRLFLEVSSKQSYIEEQDEQWRQRHFGARWEFFLEQISDEVTLIQSEEVFVNMELQTNFNKLRMPEDCNFSFFCERILLLKDTLIDTNIKIKKLRDQITGEANLKLMDTSLYFRKRAQALEFIAGAQRRWVAIQH